MVYRHADKTWHTPFFVLFYRKTSSEYRVGFVAGKKVGNAVKRNRAKRILRAHFLHVSDILSPGHYIFVAKAPLIEEPFISVSKAFRHALRRANAIHKQANH